MTTMFEYRSGGTCETWFINPEPKIDPFIIIHERNAPNYSLEYIYVGEARPRHLVSEHATLQAAQVAYKLLTSSNWKPQS